MSDPITYAERRAAGVFEADAAARAAAAAEPAAPETTSDTRVHVPLGGDAELYSTISGWAPQIAGFQRFDLEHDTPGLIGAPGLPLVDVHRGDAVLDSWLWVLEPFDGTSPAGYLVVSTLDGYAQSFTLDQLNDWQGYALATEGEGLFGTRDPLVFWNDASVSFYVGDSEGNDPGATQGKLVVVVRVLPAPPAYPV